MLYTIINILSSLIDNIYKLFASTSIISSTICLLLLFILLKKLNILSITFSPFKMFLTIIIYNLFYIIVFFGIIYLIDKII